MVKDNPLQMVGKAKEKTEHPGFMASTIEPGLIPILMLCSVPRFEDDGMGRLTIFSCEQRGHNRREVLNDQWEWE